MDTLKTRTSQWAKALLKHEFVIFDFETTGLDSYSNRVVQIGIVDQTGKVLLDTLINPGRRIPPEATDIHGISDEMVAKAPTFQQVYPAICAAMHDKRWVAYNLEFDLDFLTDECIRYGLKVPGVVVEQGGYLLAYCAMRRYAEFWGERRYGGGFTWQRLTSACRQQGIEVNGAHSSAGYCLMTLALLKKMGGVE